MCRTGRKWDNEAVIGEAVTGRPPFPPGINFPINALSLYGKRSET